MSFKEVGRPIQERLFMRATRSESGCLEWTGTTVPKGYGTIHYNGKQTYTHRAAWRELRGEAKPEPKKTPLDNFMRIGSFLKLRDGTLIRREAVITVRPCDETVSHDTTFPPRIVIDYSCESSDGWKSSFNQYSCVILNCDSVEDRDAYMAELHNELL